MQIDSILAPILFHGFLFLSLPLYRHLLFLDNATRQENSELRKNFTPHIFDEWVKNYSWSNDGQFSALAMLENLGQHYRFLFILDGLDELGEFVDIYK